MANYAKLAELERQYDAITTSEPPAKYGLFWGIITVFGFCCYIIPGILLVRWRGKVHRPKMEEWEKECQEAEERRRDVLRECQRLVV